MPVTIDDLRLLLVVCAGRLLRKPFLWKDQVCAAVRRWRGVA